MERRRRQRHLRRLRRDLLTDFGIALLLTITLIIATAGLGVIALIALPVTAAVIGSFLYERSQRKQRSGKRSARPARGR